MYSVDLTSETVPVQSLEPPCRVSRLLWAVEWRKTTGRRRCMAQREKCPCGHVVLISSPPPHTHTPTSWQAVWLFIFISLFIGIGGKITVSVSTYHPNFWKNIPLKMVYLLPARYAESIHIILSRIFKRRSVLTSYVLWKLDFKFICHARCRLSKWHLCSAGTFYTVCFEYAETEKLVVFAYFVRFALLCMTGCSVGLCSWIACILVGLHQTWLL